MLCERWRFITRKCRAARKSTKEKRRNRTRGLPFYDFCKGMWMISSVESGHFANGTNVRAMWISVTAQPVGSSTVGPLNEPPFCPSAKLENTMCVYLYNTSNFSQITTLISRYLVLTFWFVVLLTRRQI